MRRRPLASALVVAVLLGGLASVPASAQSVPVTRSIAATCPPGEVPPAGFSDVTADNVHSQAIDCLRHRGLARGVDGSLYVPGGTVDRGETAAFVARLLRDSGSDVPTTAADAFVDDDGSVHEADIDALAALGVVRGTGETSYDPRGEVHRGQMATVLVAAVEHALDLTLTTLGDRFVDDDHSAHEAAIDKLGAALVVAGSGDQAYRPGDAVGRDEMASFVVRALDLVVSRPGWARAVDLIEDCKVKGLFTTHSMSITLDLRDGTTHGATEPYVGARSEPFANAGHCPPLEHFGTE